MYSYYDASSMEAKYLKEQIEQLKDMSYTNFNYAKSFGSFKSDLSSAVNGVIKGSISNADGGGRFS